MASNGVLRIINTRTTAVPYPNQWHAAWRGLLVTSHPLRECRCVSGGG